MKHADLFLYARLVAVLGTVALLASCAPATTGLAPSGALQQQLNDIKQQQQQQAAQLQQYQQQISQLQQQLGLENTISTQIESNLSTPEQTAIPAGETTFLPEPATQFTGSQEVSAVAASASAYLSAFSDLAAGHWAAAETGFQGFLNNFSGHQYAPNARYWLANAQLSQGKIKPAISNLRRIIVDPNGQAKAPAALMQLVQLYRRQGMTSQADDVLEQLRSRYPESSEAQYFYRSNETNN